MFIKKDLSTLMYWYFPAFTQDKQSSAHVHAGERCSRIILNHLQIDVKTATSIRSLQSNNISMKKIIRAIHFLTSSDYYL
jgi:hypothetical protein